VFPVAHALIVYTSYVLVYVSCCSLFKNLMNGMFFIPHMSVVFHVKLLNILGFVQLPEKVLDKYFEIKGVLAIFSMVFGGGGGRTFVRFLNFLIQ
jgi:hypothetical protein